MSESFKARWRKVSLPNKLTVTSSFVVAFATVVYTTIALLQLKEIKNSSADTKTLAQAAKTQAENSALTAKATAQQVESLKVLTEAALAGNTTARANQALIEDFNRGRIVFRSIKLAEPIAAGKGIVVAIEMENIGKGPVKIFQESGGLRASSLPDGPMPVKLSKADTASIMQPGSNSTTFQFDNTPTTEELVKEIELKLKTVFFFGRIRYEALGKPHMLEYCFSVIRMDTNSVLETPGTKGIKSDPNFALSSCAKWNDSK